MASTPPVLAASTSMTSVAVSSAARMRAVVVLPTPDGPEKSRPDGTASCATMLASTTACMRLPTTSSNRVGRYFSASGSAVDIRQPGHEVHRHPGQHPEEHEHEAGDSQPEDHPVLGQEEHEPEDQGPDSQRRERHEEERADDEEVQRGVR